MEARARRGAGRGRRHAPARARAASSTSQSSTGRTTSCSASRSPATLRYLLVETPYFGWPLDIGDRLFRLRAAGITTVLAHPERNGEVQHRPELLEPLVASGVLVQLTAGAVDGSLGRSSRTYGLRVARARPGASDRERRSRAVDPADRDERCGGGARQRRARSLADGRGAAARSSTEGRCRRDRGNPGRGGSGCSDASVSQFWVIGSPARGRRRAQRRSPRPAASVEREQRGRGP